MNRINNIRLLFFYLLRNEYLPIQAKDHYALCLFKRDKILVENKQMHVLFVLHLRDKTAYIYFDMDVLTFEQKEYFSYWFT